MGMTTPTPHRLRPVTMHLHDAHDEPVGQFAARVVPSAACTDRGAAPWAITHALGTPAGGMHTEVAFVDDTVDDLPEHVLDDLVRLVANKLYAREWAFHYRPAQVPGSVLAYGSVLRERVEVSSVEVWT